MKISQRNFPIHLQQSSTDENDKENDVSNNCKQHWCRLTKQKDVSPTTGTKLKINNINKSILHEAICNRDWVTFMERLNTEEGQREIKSRYCPERSLFDEMSDDDENSVMYSTTSNGTTNGIAKSRRSPRSNSDGATGSPSQEVESQEDDPSQGDVSSAHGESDNVLDYENSSTGCISGSSSISTKYAGSFAWALSPTKDQGFFVAGMVELYIFAPMHVLEAALRASPPESFMVPTNYVDEHPYPIFLALEFVKETKHILQIMLSIEPEQAKLGYNESNKNYLALNFICDEMNFIMFGWELHNEENEVDDEAFQKTQHDVIKLLCDAYPGAFDRQIVSSETNSGNETIMPESRFHHLLVMAMHNKELDSDIFLMFLERSTRKYLKQYKEIIHALINNFSSFPFDDLDQYISIVLKTWPEASSIVEDRSYYRNDDRRPGQLPLQELLVSHENDIKESEWYRPTIERSFEMLVECNPKSLFVLDYEGVLPFARLTSMYSSPTLEGLWTNVSKYRNANALLWRPSSSLAYSTGESKDSLPEGTCALRNIMRHIELRQYRRGVLPSGLVTNAYTMKVTMQYGRQFEHLAVASSTSIREELVQQKMKRNETYQMCLIDCGTVSGRNKNDSNSSSNDEQQKHPSSVEAHALELTYRAVCLNKQDKKNVLGGAYTGNETRLQKLCYLSYHVDVISLHGLLWGYFHPSHSLSFPQDGTATIQNEGVTRITSERADVQGHFKAHLNRLMSNEILGCLDEQNNNLLHFICSAPVCESTDVRYNTRQSSLYASSTSKKNSSQPNIIGKTLAQSKHPNEYLKMTLHDCRDYNEWIVACPLSPLATFISCLLKSCRQVYRLHLENSSNTENQENNVQECENKFSFRDECNGSVVGGPYKSNNIEMESKIQTAEETISNHLHHLTVMKNVCGQVPLHCLLKRIIHSKISTSQIAKKPSIVFLDNHEDMSIEAPVDVEKVKLQDAMADIHLMISLNMQCVAVWDPVERLFPFMFVASASLPSYNDKKRKSNEFRKNPRRSPRLKKKQRIEDAVSTSIGDNDIDEVQKPTEVTPPAHQTRKETYHLTLTYMLFKQFVAVQDATSFCNKK